MLRGLQGAGLSVLKLGRFQANQDIILTQIQIYQFSVQAVLLPLSYSCGFQDYLMWSQRPHVLHQCLVQGRYTTHTCGICAWRKWHGSLQLKLNRVSLIRSLAWSIWPGCSATSGHGSDQASQTLSCELNLRPQEVGCSCLMFPPLGLLGLSYKPKTPTEEAQIDSRCRAGANSNRESRRVAQMHFKKKFFSPWEFYSFSLECDDKPCSPAHSDGNGRDGTKGRSRQSPLTSASGRYCKHGEGHCAWPCKGV